MHDNYLYANSDDQIENMHDELSGYDSDDAAESKYEYDLYSDASVQGDSEEEREEPPPKAQYLPSYLQDYTNIEQERPARVPLDWWGRATNPPPNF